MFIGWLMGVGKRWRPMVEDPDDAVCWRKLLDAGPASARCVLPKGQHPTDRPPKRKAGPTLIDGKDNPDGPYTP